MTFYWLSPLDPPRSTGKLNDEHKWGLPGVHCPACGASWAIAVVSYPCVDLDGLVEQAELKKAWLAENFADYERLRARVEPLVPEGMPLWPGTTFGPLVGSAKGSFGQLFMPFPWMLLGRREAVEALQDKGVHGLKGCRTELRFRQKPAPDIVEFQIEPHGLLHPDCLPSGKASPCPRCGRYDFDRPQEPMLDADSLPLDVDLFRVRSLPSMIIGTERLLDAVRSLQLEEVVFRELPARSR